VRVVVLGDEHTIYALGLLGFEGMVVAKDKALEVLTELTRSDDVGLVMVTSDLVDNFRDQFERLRMRSTRPIIAEIPSLAGVTYREVNYLAILRSALGI
jgi:V/A-type H+-transporting ATPase subunit F